AILTDVSRNPSFQQDEVARERKKHCDGLAQAESEPSTIAERVGLTLAFGRGHPYGHAPQGFLSTVEKITPEDLTRFHDTYWKPESSALIFVGDVSLAEASGLSERNFASWSGGASPAV